LKRETEAPHKLVLIGSIPWRSSAAANLEGAIGSLSMESEVVRLAYVPEEDLPKIYNLATALAFTSLYEGFGLPALEAMACGCPVVCSNSSSLPEVVGDAGILVDPTDEKDIAEGLSRVIGDSGLRKDMIARGLERAAEFSWERAAKETLCVLEDVYVQSR
jgi:glycosyltransferase involved in cell wall biosynthesis